MENIWLENIIKAIYVHFWLPKIKNEIFWNPIPENIVYSDVVLDKFGEICKYFFPCEIGES